MFKFSKWFQEVTRFPWEAGTLMARETYFFFVRTFNELWVTRQCMAGYSQGNTFTWSLNLVHFPLKRTMKQHCRKQAERGFNDQASSTLTLAKARWWWLFSVEETWPFQWHKIGTPLLPFWSRENEHWTLKQATDRPTGSLNLPESWWQSHETTNWLIVRCFVIVDNWLAYRSMSLMVESFQEVRTNRLKGRKTTRDEAELRCSSNLTVLASFLRRNWRNREVVPIRVRSKFVLLEVRNSFPQLTVKVT